MDMDRSCNDNTLNESWLLPESRAHDENQVKGHRPGYVVSRSIKKTCRRQVNSVRWLTSVVFMRYRIVRRIRSFLGYWQSGLKYVPFVTKKKSGAAIVWENG